MGAKAGISAEEYLHTSYPDLDREYRDGQIVERSLPDTLHSRTQLLLGVFFEALRQRFSLFAFPELRLKLREGLYLIPDVCVFPSRQTQSVPDQPPLIAIEIFSSDDRMSKVLEKLAAFKAWGVPHVWLVNPYTQRMFVFEENLMETPVLPIPEFDLHIAPADIFDSAASD